MVQVLNDAEIQRIREEVRQELEQKQVIQSQPVQGVLQEVGPREVLAENNKRHVYIKDAVLDEQKVVMGLYKILDKETGIISCTFEASSDIYARRAARNFKTTNPDMATTPENYVLYKVGYTYNRLDGDNGIVESILSNKPEGGRTRAPIEICGLYLVLCNYY